MSIITLQLSPHVLSPGTYFKPMVVQGKKIKHWPQSGFLLPGERCNTINETHRELSSNNRDVLPQYILEKSFKSGKADELVGCLHRVLCFTKANLCV